MIVYYSGSTSNDANTCFTAFGSIFMDALDKFSNIRFNNVVQYSNYLDILLYFILQNLFHGSNIHLFPHVTSKGTGSIYLITFCMKMSSALLLPSMTYIKVASLVL